VAAYGAHGCATDAYLATKSSARRTAGERGSHAWPWRAGAGSGGGGSASREGGRPSDGEVGALSKVPDLRDVVRTMAVEGVGAVEMAGAVDVCLGGLGERGLAGGEVARRREPRTRCFGEVSPLISWVERWRVGVGDGDSTGRMRGFVRRLSRMLG